MHRRLRYLVSSTACTYVYIHCVHGHERSRPHIAREQASLSAITDLLLVPPFVRPSFLWRVFLRASRRLSEANRQTSTLHQTKGSLLERVAWIALFRFEYPEQSKFDFVGVSVRGSRALHKASAIASAVHWQFFGTCSIRAPCRLVSSFRIFFSPKIRPMVTRNVLFTRKGS